MLSIKNGFEIAQIRDKKDKIINSIYVKDYDEDSTEENNKDVDKLIDKSFYKNISASNVILLKRALRTNNESVLKMNQSLLELFEKGKILLDDQKNKLITVEKNEHIQVVPPNTHFSVAVFGPSGVGKSYWIGQYLLSFRKKFKDRPIYIFSPIKDDKAFMKAKPIYIKIDESILKDPLQTVEFQSGLCVFDDIESLSKQYHSVISEFRDKCLEVGRHDGIDIISVHHVIQGGNSTKKIINESDYMVCFPRSNFAAIEKICRNNYGFDKEDINYIKNTGKKSRWICIKRSYPSVIMSELEIKIV